MYQSPDVIKVKVNVDDVFASYPVTGCEMGGYMLYNDSPPPCNSTFVKDATYVGMGLAYQCYASDQP